jgi:hypothetical protein
MFAGTGMVSHRESSKPVSKKRAGRTPGFAEKANFQRPLRRR